jgi:hypothetical protein
MATEADVIRQLKELVKAKGDIFFNAEITAITGDTCSIRISGGLELTDVMLKVTNDKKEDKFIMIPTVGSIVLVSCNNGDLRDISVIGVDDPERIFYKHKDVSIDIDAKTGKIIINGGDLGGLIKIEELVNRLNAIEDYVKNFQTKYDAHVHTGVTPGSGSTAVTVSILGTPPEKSQRDPLEDKNVTH